MTNFKESKKAGVLAVCELLHSINDGTYREIGEGPPVEECLEYLGSKVENWRPTHKVVDGAIFQLVLAVLAEFHHDV
jgi:hypothetical protein